MIKTAEIICDYCGKSAESAKGKPEKARYAIEICDYDGRYYRKDVCQKDFQLFSRIFNLPPKNLNN